MTANYGVEKAEALRTLARVNVSGKHEFSTYFLPFYSGVLARLPVSSLRFKACTKEQLNKKINAA